MRRDVERLKARRAHIRQYVERFEGKTVKAVQNLSTALFLSESTIWKDLKKG